MDSLRVVECDILGAVASEYPLGFATEYNLLDPLYIAILSTSLGSFLLLLIGIARGGKLELIVHDGLLLVPLASVVSALHELLDEPLYYWIYLGIIETLDLLGCKEHRAVHLLESGDDFFRDLDLLTHVEVISEFNVDVEVATSYGPAHAAQNLIEGIYSGEAGSEVATSDKDVVDFLNQLLLCFLLHVRDLARVLRLKHLCFCD